ncbi:MAG: RsiV family protein [Patescibacteria group bacterium]
MLTKKQFIIFILALAALAAFVVVGFRTSGSTDPEGAQNEPIDTTAALWPSREVEKISVDQKTTYADITGSYPKTASDSITMYFKSFVEEQVSQFLDDTSWAGEVESAASGNLTLDISYKSVESSTVQTYIFTVNSYTGGAHGLQFRKTFAFNKEGQLLTLSNLFSNGFDGFPAFAKVVQKELLKRPSADANWIGDGAAAREENYRSFVVTDTGITILFDPYQVAPWSDGAIDIAIPVASLGTTLKADFWPSR